MTPPQADRPGDAVAEAGGPEGGGHDADRGAAGGIEAARAAKQQLRAELAGHPHVVGVGISGSAGAYRLEVRARADLGAVVPAEVAGVPVRVQIVGEIHAG